MPGLISPTTLEQIRAASDIVEVIGSYVPLKRAGANFVALCPFHKEKSPSFNVNPHKQIFHCFGCHKGGDVFSFVREFENIGFMEAVRRLADRAHIPLETERNEAGQQVRHVKESLLQIHEQITQRWQSALAGDAAGQIARDYLAKRGVPDEAVKLFRLGYAPDKWDDTVNWAKSKGHDLPLVEQAGLILRKEGADHYYDRFRGRLIFPICDEQGRVIGFSGRVLSGDEKTAKYVNSPETPIFTKGKVIFGLDKSKRAMLDAQCAVICEGQLDLIACFMAGVKNVVAPQGTALTGDHTRLLKRYVDEVVLCFDSDTAGQAAAIRSLDSLLASGLAIRVATVPAPHDPDSFIKENGGAAFQQLIDGAEGFFDFYLHHLCLANDVATDKGRLAVVGGMGEAVHKTGNVVLTDKYAQKTALRLGVSSEAVRAEFRKVLRPIASSNETRGEVHQPVEEAALQGEELWLVRLVLENSEHIDWVSHFLDVSWLTNSIARKIVVDCISAQRNGMWNGVAAFLAECEDEQLRRVISGAVANPREIPDAEKVLKGDPNRDDPRGVVQKIRDRYLDLEIAILAHRLRNPATPEDELLKLSTRQRYLRQLKSKPLVPLDTAGGEAVPPFA